MKAVEIEFLMKGNLKQGLREVGGEADVLDSRLRGLRNTVGGIFAVDKSAEYIKKIVDVRGEIESLQISFVRQRETNCLETSRNLPPALP